MSTILTFDTTHHALWAEQIAEERGLAVLVVHAPPAANAKCDIALEVAAEDLAELERALEAAGVSFRPVSS